MNENQKEGGYRAVITLLPAHPTLFFFSFSFKIQRSVLSSVLGWYYRCWLLALNINSVSGFARELPNTIWLSKSTSTSTSNADAFLFAAAAFSVINRCIFFYQLAAVNLSVRKKKYGFFRLTHKKTKFAGFGADFPCKSCDIVQGK